MAASKDGRVRGIWRLTKRALGAVLAAALWASPVLAEEPEPVNRTGDLPKYFVRLADVDPTIVQDMRYATRFNFIGMRIDGYERGVCITTWPVAKALKAVQAELVKDGLSLIVFDCYRPSRAVDQFNRWLASPGGMEMKTLFYPDLDKTGIRKGRYIARRSRHSRGSAVDLAFVRPPYTIADPATADPSIPCDAPFSERFPDSNLDFGTGFDCFSLLSHTASLLVPVEAARNREKLLALMERHGFRNYRREWWHFDYVKEVYAKTYFNFPVN